MEKVRMNNGLIGGHEYTIEKMSQTRELYCFNDKNYKGERIEVEFVKIENNHKGHLINLWYKKVLSKNN